MDSALLDQLPNLTQSCPQRLLLVEDEKSFRDIYEELLTSLGHHCVSTGSAEEGIEKLHNEQFDILITDINLPNMDGLELLHYSKSSYPGMDVIVMTGYGELYVYNEVIRAGASDFLTKPFKMEEMQAKLSRVIRERMIFQELTSKNRRLRELEQLVSRRLKEIEVTQGVTVTTLAKIAEHRDPMIGGHLDRMQRYSTILAQSLADKPGYQDVLNDDYISMIEKGSILHDIGKIGIPEGILLKPGRLTSAEWVLMKMHTTIGAGILGEADQQLRKVLDLPETFLTMANEIAVNHHERWDGQGYPVGLAGERIPISARIVILADVYDALTSRRCYKSAFPHSESKSMIMREAGKAFDPLVVESFFEQEEAISNIRATYQ